ncbi:MAG TPA: glycosyltransferase family 2 protein [Candidatus Limnocylindrales bacterium]|nr:glycosyltransferase family 2 protein [Candidatus Limnocylindrales bacterium]
MNLSIIIPNYNGEKLLQKNLPLVLEAVNTYKRGRVEIVIPDDPSTDNSRNVIKKFIEGNKYRNITILTINNDRKKEAGFSKNVNRGVGIATGDILILLNSDVYPNKDFLEPLLNGFEDERVFAIGCLDESHENGKKVLRGRGTGSFKRGFLAHRAGEIDQKTTFWVSGGSGAFRRKIWEKLGGFDPLYDPFYWEDIDMSYRAQKSGYKVLFDSRSVVTHEHEKGTVKEMFDEQFVKKISYRNQFIFVWKNITDSKLLIEHVLWLPYHFLKAILSGDWPFLKGFILAILIIDKISKSRQSAEKFFIISDLEVIKING